ncbi:MAG: YtxH domain-containing protein [Stigonema ocellatum SAG 48.90 = DSM 106950]|nr:YtxH domain-containing protein [Stigonema ocellatum SAG 48.90 = DSM 106950]
MSNNRSGVFIGGFMLGATIGALTGLLVAPRTGRETRQLLKKSADALPELAEDLSTTVQIQADRLSANALKNWDDTLERLREAIASGIEASQRESQTLQRQNPVEVESVATRRVENSDSLTQHQDS